MARDQKQGWVVFATMFVLWLGMLLIVAPLEARGSPKLAAAGANQQTTSLQAGGNLEGKGTRLRPVSSGYFPAVPPTTADCAVKRIQAPPTPLPCGTVVV